jgi:hypothetical protein
MIDKFLTGENVKVNGEIAGRRYILRTDLQLHVQSVPITTKVVSSNPFHGEVYSIQHYVIKFVSDLLVSPDSPVSSTNKTDCKDITEILLTVALNAINHSFLYQ